MYRNNDSQFLKWDNCFIKMLSSSPMCFILVCVKLQRPQSRSCEDGFWIVLSEVSLLGCWHTKCHQRHRGLGCFDVVLLPMWMKHDAIYMMQYDENVSFQAFTTFKEFYREVIRKTHSVILIANHCKDFSFERQEQRLNVIRTSFGVKLTSTLNCRCFDAVPHLHCFARPNSRSNRITRIGPSRSWQIGEGDLAISQGWTGMT